MTRDQKKVFYVTTSALIHVCHQKYVRCIILIFLGHFGDCTSNKPCGEDEGDCDLDNQCKKGFNCGTNNCRSSLGFEPFFDCCYGIEEDFCTLENPCSEDQGDCDSHAECQVNLRCGLNNCADSLGYDTEVDCCYKTITGDENFCTSDTNPCGINEGDCDSNNECQTSLVCDTTNSCPASVGFDADANCCRSNCKFQFIISMQFQDSLNSHSNILFRYTK